MNGQLQALNTQIALEAQRSSQNLAALVADFDFRLKAAKKKNAEVAKVNDLLHSRIAQAYVVEVLGGLRGVGVNLSLAGMALDLRVATSEKAIAATEAKVLSDGGAADTDLHTSISNLSNHSAHTSLLQIDAASDQHPEIVANIFAASMEDAMATRDALVNELRSNFSKAMAKEEAWNAELVKRQHALNATLLFETEAKEKLVDGTSRLHAQLVELFESYESLQKFETELRENVLAPRRRARTNSSESAANTMNATKMSSSNASEKKFSNSSKPQKANIGRVAKSVHSRSKAKRKGLFGKLRSAISHIGQGVRSMKTHLFDYLSGRARAPKFAHVGNETGTRSNHVVVLRANASSTLTRKTNMTSSHSTTSAVNTSSSVAAKAALAANASHPVTLARDKVFSKAANAEARNLSLAAAGRGRPLGHASAQLDAALLALRSLGEHRGATVAGFMRDCDSDSSGSISPDEFEKVLMLIRRAKPNSLSKVTSRLFHHLDANSDGQLQPKELAPLAAH
eukprot:TRINITY_DN8845_c0_g1_i8.p1 TRINITY_DN8845_c0_g1~~TRINITY_DN8845_c0_g1_i8.p1  ORF type:complete len:575 (-),score=114.15 TRINITY_DN8845_c0_g1_i8:147-1685(-)